MSLEGEGDEMEGGLEGELGVPQEEPPGEPQMMRLQDCDPRFLQEIAKLDKIIVKHTASVKHTSNSLSKQYIAKKKREEEEEGIGKTVKLNLYKGRSKGICSFIISCNTFSTVTDVWIQFEPIYLMIALIGYNNYQSN